MYEYIFFLFIGTLLTESVTEIVSKSILFSPLRKWLSERKTKFFFNLIDCPFCFSVWAGVLVSIVLNLRIPFIEFLGVFSYPVSYFFSGLILHKLANIIHDLHDRVYYGYQKPDIKDDDNDDEEKAGYTKVTGF